VREHAGRAGATGPNQDQCRLSLLPNAAALHFVESPGPGRSSRAPEWRSDLPNAQRSQSRGFSQCSGEFLLIDRDYNFTIDAIFLPNIP